MSSEESPDEIVKRVQHFMDRGLFEMLMKLPCQMRVQLAVALLIGTSEEVRHR